MAGFSEGHFEWELKNFKQLEGKQTSDVFRVGSHRWILKCFPKQAHDPHEHVSVFIEPLKPPNLGPKATFALTIKNHNDPSKDATKRDTHSFNTGDPDWGFSRMLPLSELNDEESGFLRPDGALVIRAELKVDDPCLRVGVSDMARDFLALLDSPGATSDLTLLAGRRSFPAHRAILAARCPYFKALFESGLSDADAREVAVPDEASPDAVALLLRAIYGDAPACAPELLKPAAELADRWLLAGARDALHEHIGLVSSSETVIADLLWAEGRGGAEALVGQLESVYVSCAGEVPEADIEGLADANPRLLARLLKAVTKGGGGGSGGDGGGSGASKRQRTG
ncbi:hypothetical protein GPECTOR_4g874 [Gonium pectorale]|uniref:BTB domain-containing protein n=1 Tax=Gonium pectorale TaxID=33097 RepID=A0A150GYG5_GONPE|nr:hypothetical protein GPECTOR_4g874 [Gonium pectorale]|eukprot:KXZ54803.1 hypothetical protein GPECTOR_4g874 [Gonium pectorale]